MAFARCGATGLTAILAVATGLTAILGVPAKGCPLRPERSAQRDEFTGMSESIQVNRCCLPWIGESMMLNSYYTIYQAERDKTTAEFRAADAQIGEFASGLGRLGSALATPGRVIRRSLRRWRPAA